MVPFLGSFPEGLHAAWPWLFPGAKLLQTQLYYRDPDETRTWGCLKWWEEGEVHGPQNVLTKPSGSHSGDLAGLSRKESLLSWLNIRYVSTKQAPWKKSYDQPRQHIKKQRYYFADKGQYNQSYGFSSGHVQMWELAHKEGWVPKNWCFWTVVLEKTLESLLDSKEIQLVYSKGNQSWIFIGRTDIEAEAPILWPSDVKSQLIGKDPDPGKDWG